MRRELVRDDLVRLMGVIDPLLKVLAGRVQSDRQPIVDEDWDKLVEALRQVERLTGGWCHVKHVGETCADT